MRDRCLLGIGLVVAMLVVAVTGRADTVPIAVAGFTYVDTSGEVGNQTEAHTSRLRSFMQDLGADLQRSGRYDVHLLACANAMSCAQDKTASELMDEARHADARLLLFGGIHKESTLIEWMKADVVKLSDGKVVYDRLLTFRGDSDQAWREAAAFLARDLAAQQIVP